ncbi:MAG: hypothetical protein ACRD4O_20145 [Bryobacteraceae bacterium]
MNIDERLEKLTERHEALTQTVELIVSMQRENEKRFEKRFEQNENRVERLITILEHHEKRISGLESNG